MPRTRSPLRTHHKSNSIIEVHQWLLELHQDVNPATGYLNPNPTTLYGKRIKELVNYTCSQSSEVKTILTSRRIRTSSCCLYLLEVFRFLADYVIPVSVALYSASVYYASTQEEEIAEIQETNTTVEKGDVWVEGIASAGGWLGETIRYGLSLPLSFVMSTIDGGLHISQGVHYIRNRTELIFYTPLLFVCVYFATLVGIRFLLNLYTICSAERALWNYQEQILQETSQVVERAVTSIMRPALLLEYDRLATTPVRDMHATHLSIMEHLTTEIKAKPLAQLLILGNVSTNYTNSLRMLIRHADDELSSAMFQLTTELHKIEGGLPDHKVRPRPLVLSDTT
jgi:hypothetical protein